jgi:LDH2 family malate/lactate/ureidoglycolate dehydrogenase
VPTLPASELEDLARRVLVAAGSPKTPARVVAESLVRSNLKGVDSHGIVRVAEYLAAIADGRIVAGASPVASEDGGIIQIDGRRSFGQVAARVAAERTAARAPDHGVAVGSVVHVHHVGRLGEYVELIADAGLVGLAFCNTGPAGGRVAPFGGRRPALPTNPLAYAVPAAGRPPIVADFSTSAAAEGRVRLARQNGYEVPDGWIVDADGRPTRNPAALYEGGALLPAGGHRGYALALLVELLGGALAGAGCASTGAVPGNGVVLIALAPGWWGDPGTFLSQVEAVARTLVAVDPAPGVDRVRLPGDIELEVEAERRRDGIPVPDATWAELAGHAGRLGVAPAAL